MRKLAEDVCDVIAARALKDLAMTIHFEPLEMRETTWREAQRVPAEEAITTTIEASGGGHLYQVMDPALASVLVERLLGADPDPSLPPRPLTAIDRSLLRRVNELIVASWDQLWSDLTDTTLAPGGAQPHRMLAMAHDATDPTLLIAFQVRLGGSYAVLHVLLPQATIAPVAARFSRPSARGNIDDPAATQALQSRLGGAGVRVRVRLGRVRLTAAAISQLTCTPGDRVPLGVSPATPAALVRRRGDRAIRHVARSGTHRAVQIGAGTPAACGGSHEPAARPHRERDARGRSASIEGAEAGAPIMLPRGADPFAGAERPLLLAATRWTAVSPGGVVLGGTPEALSAVLGFELPARPEVSAEDAEQARRSTDEPVGEESGTRRQPVRTASQRRTPTRTRPPATLRTAPATARTRPCRRAAGATASPMPRASPPPAPPTA